MSAVVAACGLSLSADGPAADDASTDAGASTPALDGEGAAEGDAEVALEPFDEGGAAAAAGEDGSARVSAPEAGDSGLAPPLTPQPGQRTGPGVLPPKVASTTYEGALVYDNPAIARDLGFSGVVNGQVVWTFGDTLLATSATTLVFSASDSAALGDVTNPTHVHDKSVGPSGGPLEWIPLTGAERDGGGLGRYAEGGTNVVEYAPNKGLVWFLENDRGPGGPGILGAGVATVTAGANGPVATRLAQTMWSSFEPYWGDVGVTYDALDHNVYVFGHGPASASLSGDVFLAKAPAAQATEVSAYQYWDQSQSAWTTARFANGQLGTVDVSSSQAIFTNHALGQSNAFWSNYYDTWMFVYGADVGYTDVMVMTAPTLEGPWTTGVTLASTCPTTCSATRYAIAPHPEFDPTGKTLLVTWTDSNVIHAAKIEWT